MEVIVKWNLPVIPVVSSSPLGREDTDAATTGTDDRWYNYNSQWSTCSQRGTHFSMCYNFGKTARSTARRNSETGRSSCERGEQPWRTLARE